MAVPSLSLSDYQRIRLHHSLADMSVANPASSSSDPWDYPIPERSSGPRNQVSQKVQVVPDDWDADDDDEEEEPQKVWETANNQAPMPQLVISSSTMGSSSTLPPPPAAFQPSLRILKRPCATPSTSASSSSSDLQKKSYAEREAQYQAARERIFGDETPISASNNSNIILPRTSQSQPRSPSVASNPSPTISATSAVIHPRPRGSGSDTQSQQPIAKTRSANEQGAGGVRGRRGGKKGSSASGRAS